MLDEVEGLVVALGGEVIFRLEETSEPVIFARIDEAWFGVVDRAPVTVGLIREHLCEGWSPPCSEAPVEVFLIANPEDRETILQATTDAGGQVLSEVPGAEVRLIVELPVQALSALQSWPLLRVTLLGEDQGRPVEDDPYRFLLYLGEGHRFHAIARWSQPFSGSPGLEARAQELSADTGAFSFFDAQNLELVVKVLEACSINNSYWVFVSGLTDLRVELTVIDTHTSRTAVYEHVGATPFEPVADIRAFPCE